VPVNARIRVAPAILHVFNSYAFSLRTENGINMASNASFFDQRQVIIEERVSVNRVRSKPAFQNAGARGLFENSNNSLRRLPEANPFVCRSLQQSNI
jgi:hypothetical protein